MQKRMVVVEAFVPDLPVPQPPTDAHPEHPIYIPITPPPDSGLSPEHPIYLPVDPGYGVPEGAHPDHTLPGDLPHPEHPIYLPGPGEGAHPEHPIYYPLPPSDLHPEHPIVLPPELPPLNDAQKEALKAFLFGNLPPFTPPNYVAPV